MHIGHMMCRIIEGLPKQFKSLWKVAYYYQTAPHALLERRGGRPLTDNRFLKYLLKYRNFSEST